MPGVLPKNFRGGSRSEYLAQYIFSTLGVSVPVPHQEDIGADFHCTLAEPDGKRLIFKGSFLAQVKSVSEKNQLYFGGLDDKREWKQEGVKWLFGQELPLLIGLVDKDKLSMDLFSTSNMWQALYKAGKPSTILLQPNIPSGSDDVVRFPTSEPQTNWPLGMGDGLLWKIPLGPALVAIGIDDLEDEQKLQTFRRKLQWAVDLEQNNIRYARLKVHFSRWPVKIKTNHLGPNIEYGVGLAGAKLPGMNVNEQLRAMAPIIGTLALNYELQNDHIGFNAMKAIAKMLPKDMPETQELVRLVADLFDEQLTTGLNVTS